MSEYTKYGETTSKRRLRNHRRTVSEYSYCIGYCHHWNKSYSVSDLAKCGSAKWEMYFWMPCLKKYKPTMSKSKFIKIQDNKKRPCLVCQNQCMCYNWEFEAVNTDLKKIEKLLSQQNSPFNEKENEDKSDTKDEESKTEESIRNIMSENWEIKTVKDTQPTPYPTYIPYNNFQNLQYMRESFQAMQSQIRRRDTKDMMKSMATFLPPMPHNYAAFNQVNL